MSYPLHDEFGYASHYVATRCGAAVDFFNQVNLLYGTLTEFCTPENCPTMSAGPKYKFKLFFAFPYVQYFSKKLLCSSPFFFCLNLDS